MRTIPLRETWSNPWDARLVRLRRRWGLVSGDALNALSWHLLGGRRFFEDHWQPLARAQRWVFILGCNNSGTSLLQRLLEWTGAVSTFPAEGQLYTRALKRDRRRVHARVWTEYLETLRLERGDSLNPAPRLLHDWMHHLPRPLAPVIVEKTPANTARAEWLQQVFPNACFIGLVRNGYAVSEGIRRKARQPLAAGARHWNAVNRLLSETACGLDDYLELRYETLTERPAATMAQLCEFIGIDNARVHNLAGRDESEARASLTTVFGPVHNCNPETIARLSKADRALIQEEAHEMLDRLGYAYPISDSEG